MLTYHLHITFSYHRLIWITYNTHLVCTCTYCTLRGRIKGTLSVIQRGGARYTARHVITVIVLAFLTQENKAGKIQSTINQLKHGKGRAVRAIMVLGVLSIDHTALGYASCCMALSTPPLVPLLHVQHFLPCFTTCT